MQLGSLYFRKPTIIFHSYFVKINVASTATYAKEKTLGKTL